MSINSQDSVKYVGESGSFLTDTFHHYQADIREGINTTLQQTSNIELIPEDDFKELIAGLVEGNRYRNNGEGYIKSPLFVNHLLQVEASASKTVEKISTAYSTLSHQINNKAVSCAALIHDLGKIFVGHHFHEVEGVDWFLNRGGYKLMIPNAEAIETGNNEEQKQALRELKYEVVRIILTDLCIYEGLVGFDEPSYRKGSDFMKGELTTFEFRTSDETKAHFLEMRERFKELAKTVYPELKTGLVKTATLPTTLNQAIMLHADMSGNGETADMKMKERWEDVEDRYYEVILNRDSGIWEDNPDYDPMFTHQLQDETFRRRIFAHQNLIEELASGSVSPEVINGLSTTAGGSEKRFIELLIENRGIEI